VLVIRFMLNFIFINEMISLNSRNPKYEIHTR
jgi:hypothetical protein